MKDEAQTHSSRSSQDDKDLPRFTKLQRFDPHRKSFVCKYEADVNPPITPEADALFQQAKRLTSNELWPDDRNYAKAAPLYEQAMKLGHWKAQFNLAGLYLKGRGVPQSSEKAIELTEDLMKKGVPAAWDNMGTMYMGGVGSLKQDATVAYAFWQRAADMGSMASQTYIGAKLLGTHDEPPSFWGNRTIARKMLECAVTQGYAQAAYELGVDLDGNDMSLGEDYARSLRVLHESVKFGSEQGSGYIGSSFSRGYVLVGNVKDPARSERYYVLSDALSLNPDLRFPNLDKILPLPPAPLPKWNGDKQTLIDAAKQIVPLNENEALKLIVSTQPAYVRGTTRESRFPVTQLTVRGNRPCPRTGIWEPSIGDDHPLVRVFRSFNRQSYVEKGQPFPDYRDIYLNIDPSALQWRWLDNANEPAAVGTQITLSDLHDEQGRPLP